MSQSLPRGSLFRALRRTMASSRVLVPPRLLCVHEPWPGAERLVALIQGQSVHSSVSNVAVVVGGRLFAMRSAAPDSTGPRTSFSLLAPRRGRLSPRDAAEQLHSRLSEGRACLVDPAPGDFVAMKSHGIGLFLDQELGSEASPALVAEAAAGLVAMAARADAAWCRAVAPCLDPHAVEQAYIDLLDLEPSAAQDIAAGISGISTHPVAFVLKDGRLERVSFFTASRTVTRARYPLSLPSPVLAGMAGVAADVVGTGEFGARAWKDLKRLSPWLARQACRDAVLRRLVLSGREIGPMVSRRLRLGDRQRRRLMSLLAELQDPATCGEQSYDFNNPALAPFLPAFMRGTDPRLVADVLPLLPEAAFSKAEIGWFPAKGAILQNILRRVWSLPSADGYQNPRIRFWIADEILGGGRDWRARHPPYALENMARLVANGGLGSVFRGRPSQRETMEWIGLADDLRSVRSWGAAQLVAPAVVRAAARMLAGHGTDDPVARNLVDRMRCAIGHVDPIQEGGHRSPEWLSRGAAALCSDTLLSPLAGALLPAFADLAFPRSAKRLRSLVSRYHAELAARGVRVARTDRDGDVRWHPLLTLPVVLADHPEVVFVALTGAAELLEEGEEMAHCVGAYSRRCAGGWVHVLSVRDARDGRRLSTLHLQARRSAPDGTSFERVEHRGPRNGQPPAHAEAAAVRLCALLASPGAEGLPVHPETLNPPMHGISGFVTEHDPFGPDAADAEASALAVFTEGGLTAADTAMLAERLVRGPVPWTRLARSHSGNVC
jgi:hypothetical protein